MKPRKSLLKIASLLLTVWLLNVSCVSDPEIIIQKVEVLPQEVIFPDFPVFYADQIEYDGDIVLVPEWLWVEISLYQLEVEKTEEQYLLFRQ